MMTKKKHNQNRVYPPFGRMGWVGFDWAKSKVREEYPPSGRILVVGLAASGKSSLVNSLVGWTISEPNHPPPPEKKQSRRQKRQGVELTEADQRNALYTSEWLEDFGLFCLLDLPENPDTYSILGTQPVSEAVIHDLAREADLILYMLNGETGVQVWDYRWLKRLQRFNKPTLVLLNKSDTLQTVLPHCVADIEARLARTVLPVSALAGRSVLDRLVPEMITLCPQLAEGLEQTLIVARRQLAEQRIRRAALFNAWVALQPIPFLDWPIQARVMRGLRRDLAGLYQRPEVDLYRPAVKQAVHHGLTRRLFFAQLIKLIPIIGSLISFVMALNYTWLAGRMVVADSEANSDESVLFGWDTAHRGFERNWQLFQTLWQRWMQHKHVHMYQAPGKKRPAPVPMPIASAYPLTPVTPLPEIHLPQLPAGQLPGGVVMADTQNSNQLQHNHQYVE